MLIQVSIHRCHNDDIRGIGGGQYLSAFLGGWMQSSEDGLYVRVTLSNAFNEVVVGKVLVLYPRECIFLLGKNHYTLCWFHAQGYKRVFVPDQGGGEGVCLLA